MKGSRMSYLKKETTMNRSKYSEDGTQDFNFVGDGSETDPSVINLTRGGFVPSKGKRTKVDPDKVKMLSRINKKKNEHGMVSYPDEKPVPKAPEKKALLQNMISQATKKGSKMDQSTMSAGRSKAFKDSGMDDTLAGGNRAFPLVRHGMQAKGKVPALGARLDVGPVKKKKTKLSE